MDWSAKVYQQFEDERTRPARDLLKSLIGRPVTLAIDLGCGPGNSTEVMVEFFPAAKVEALDRSPDMIAVAQKRLPQVPILEADLNQWQAAKPYDLMVSNAVLQWIPDHERLLPRLVKGLSPAGFLAIQMPDNMLEPVQLAMVETARSMGFADKFLASGAQRTEIKSAEEYYRLLMPHCRAIDIWKTTYYHTLAGGVEAVIDWFKSTGLRPFLNPLNKDEQKMYLDDYRERLSEIFKPLPDGSVLLPFPRLFIVAQR